MRWQAIHSQWWTPSENWWKVCENRQFTTSELSEQFPLIYWTVLYDVITEKLPYQKYCARWVLKVLSKNHKIQWMGSALDFLSQYNAEGETFISKIMTGNVTWLSYIAITLLGKHKISVSVQMGHFWPSSHIAPIWPSDFHLFIKMKKCLGSQCFDDNKCYDKLNATPGDRILYRGDFQIGKILTNA